MVKARGQCRHEPISNVTYVKFQVCSCCGTLMVTMMDGNLAIVAKGVIHKDNSSDAISDVSVQYLAFLDANYNHQTSPDSSAPPHYIKN